MQAVAPVDCDPDQPMAQMVDVVYLVDGGDQADKDLLVDVFGIGPVAGVGHCQTKHHVAMFADDLLKRKIFANIARVREDFDRGPAAREDDSAGASESPSQRMGRHQLLIRLGGISFFAPVLYFWVGQFLPGLILDFIRMLTS